MRAHIFSSKRRLKLYYEEAKKSDALMDCALEVGDFLERVCWVEGCRANDYERLLLMRKACKQSKDLEEKLGISADFFAFLKNNHYLFSFFRELVTERKSIKDLQNSDYYASYNEHLEILDRVFQNYLRFLREAGLYDELSLPLSYKLDEDFLDEFEGFVYHLDGFLSGFELTLLAQIATRKELILCFKTSKFNEDYLQNSPILSFFKPCRDCAYEIDLHRGMILKQTPISSRPLGIKVRSFELRILQVAFVLDEISRFVKEGISPENIVLITPDESFCELLRLYDGDKNLNHASGISIKESLFYQRLRALYESARLESFSFYAGEDYFAGEDRIFDLHNTLLHHFGLDFEDFKQKFEEKCDWDAFEALIRTLLKDEKQELQHFIEEQFYHIKSLLENQSLKFKELLELFFIQIRPFKQSSVGGGKVTAMGILESRGLGFEGVIVVDFNEDLIPQRSVNEMFLNNEVRKKAGLISCENRDNLQRFYYEQLFKGAKKVSISYVENEEKTASRFLQDLDFAFDFEAEFSDRAYLNSLRPNYKITRPDLAPIPAPRLRHDLFAKPLSYTRLRTFLEQKRSYFYRYILNLKEPRALNFTQGGKDLGNFIHKILEQYYRQNSAPIDEKIFTPLLEKEARKAGIDRLELEILKLRFQALAKSEAEHFARGYAPVYLEAAFESKLTCLGKEIKLVGKIDRIDRGKLGYLIIDYKSGKLDASYQLAFYELLLRGALKREDIIQAQFYDLNRAALTRGKSRGVGELLKALEGLVGQSEVVFENKNAQYCPYKLLYEKGLK